MHHRRRTAIQTYLLLLIAKLLPPRTEQLADLTEPSVGVLCLDALAPVLAEEHVCRQCAFGCFGILLGLTAAAAGLLSLLSLAALIGCKDQHGYEKSGGNSITPSSERE